MEAGESVHERDKAQKRFALLRSPRSPLLWLEARIQLLPGASEVRRRQDHTPETSVPPLGPTKDPRTLPTHLRPLSAAICSFGWRADREPALGAAISRFSRAMRAAPRAQTHREPAGPQHPSPVRRRATRLRSASPSSAPYAGPALPERPPQRAQAQNPHGGRADQWG